MSGPERVLSHYSELFEVVRRPVGMAVNAREWHIVRGSWRSPQASPVSTGNPHGSGMQGQHTWEREGSWRGIYSHKLTTQEMIGEGTQIEALN